jgi:hypothetical protein
MATVAQRPFGTRADSGPPEARVLLQPIAAPSVLGYFALASALDDGCCGLAGSFGYEAGDKYDVSMRAGEQKLLPAARDADRDTLVITDGFSCRSQIEHGAHGRRSLHLAEVLALAYREHGALAAERADGHSSRTALLVTTAVGAVAGSAVVLGRRLAR